MLAVAERDLLLFVRTPELVVFAVLQPALVVVMFRYVFAGAVAVPGGDYADFLLPGLFAQTVLFGAVGTGVGLAEDLARGVVDRFRSLPIARAAVLGGRVLAELARTAVLLLLMAGMIVLLGFRPDAPTGRWPLVLGVLLAYAFAWSWVFTLVGLLASGPEGAEAIGFPMLIPFAFASSAFVPVETMPGWLQAFAAHQPLTAAAQGPPSSRARVASAAAVTSSLLWSVAIVSVVAPLAVHRWRHLS
jgi:ABC-2 type transport system permease protein/oleandomycin transport system permease protein